MLRRRLCLRMSEGSEVSTVKAAALSPFLGLPFMGDWLPVRLCPGTTGTPAPLMSSPSGPTTRRCRNTCTTRLSIFDLLRTYRRQVARYIHAACAADELFIGAHHTPLQNTCTRRQSSFDVKLQYSDLPMLRGQSTCYTHAACTADQLFIRAKPHASAGTPTAAAAAAADITSTLSESLMSTADELLSSPTTCHCRTSAGALGFMAASWPCS